MSNHAARRYVVCYDITEPRRLGRIHRLMKKHGMAVQYSVFECWLTESALGSLVENLRELMDESTDDIRIYGLRAGVPIATVGCQVIPDGVQRFSSGATSGLFVDADG